jgi:hypothetical protein
MDPGKLDSTARVPMAQCGVLRPLLTRIFRNPALWLRPSAALNPLQRSELSCR